MHRTCHPRNYTFETPVTYGWAINELDLETGRAEATPVDCAKDKTCPKVGHSAEGKQNLKRVKIEVQMSLFVCEAHLVAPRREKPIVAINLLMQKRVGPFDDVQSRATLPEDCQLCVLRMRKRIVPRGSPREDRLLHLLWRRWSFALR
jgi:hypothetical protein